MPYEFTCAYCGKQCIERTNVIARSYCSRECHYAHTRTVEQASKRFWDRVDRSGGPESCWEWQWAIDSSTGYGQFSFRGRSIGAHRFAWEATHGPIPKGMAICHTCDNRSCVNPDHLFLGTQADNMRDRNAKGRQLQGTRHHQAKLTEDDVREIRALRRSLTLKEIARRFNITESSVSNIVRHQTWRHVN